MSDRDVVIRVEGDAKEFGCCGLRVAGSEYGLCGKF
jgi:hypothetical protein